MIQSDFDPSSDLHWSTNAGYWQFEHSVKFHQQSTTSTPELQTAFLRVIGHVLVDHMPERALHELVNSLKEMYLFYDVDVEKPQPQRLPQFGRPLEVKLIERPPMHITED